MMRLLNLNIGENTITITVTPEDGTATEEYTITVTRAEEISSGATLQSLSLSGLTLDPVFDSATTMYTAEAAEALETTMVEAMATYVAATVEGDGEVSLTVGENTVEVMVNGRGRYDNDDLYHNGHNTQLGRHVGFPYPE